MNKLPLYLTTTLPYVNAKPHVGHALEFVQADVIARSARLAGREVFFNTGADEHGQKIWEQAQKKGQDVQEYVDHYAGELQKLTPVFHLSNDAFVRTTSDAHVAAVQEWWKRAEANGDIYKKSYKGLYCVSCEMFLKDKDMEHGRCIVHPEKEPIELEEENYFFRFSRYQDVLLEYLQGEGAVVPDHRRYELIAFVQDGLEDLSISRQKSRMAWGVPVPGDDEHVVYVWFDALLNYISTLGWPHDPEKNFEKFWMQGQRVQVAGKDQLRFQSLMWQAMLLSAGLPQTQQVFYHGFITSNGRKMSKSVGNVIDPFALVDQYGTDAVRYYFLRHIHPTDDSDLTWEKFHEAYTAHLVNGLGNVVSRVLTMAEKYEVSFPEGFIESGVEPSLGLTEDVEQYVAAYRFDLAMDEIWSSVHHIDKAIDDEKPFKVAKDNMVDAQNMVRRYVERLLVVWRDIRPFLPETADTLRQSLLALQKPESPLFPRREYNNPQDS